MGQTRILLYVSALVSAVTLAIGVVTSLPDGNLHVVFCDVGQGDGIYIRLPDGRDVVIDGGPNSKILNCLGKKMAFFDREIDLMILTHPHEDHFTGLIEILKRYKVTSIVAPPIENDESELYSSFVKVVSNEGALVKNLYQGERIEFIGQKNRGSTNSKVVFTSLWPNKQWVADNASTVLTNGNLAVKTSYNDLNDFSQVLHMSFGDFDVLFTGDAEFSILEQIKNQNLLPRSSIEVIKVPHQGNKNALTKDLVSYIKPKLGVIMVGKNSFGHPSPQTTQLLQNEGVVVRRTDQDGSIEVSSTGKDWGIR